VGGVDGLAFKEQLTRLFEVAGTGVLLTMVGSTIVAVQLVVVVLKVMKKQPPADGGRARKGGEAKPAKERDKPKAADKPKREKGKDKQKGKGADALTSTDEAVAEGAADVTPPEAATDDSGGGRKGRAARGKRGRGR
jgi:hypothetical protein